MTSMNDPFLKLLCRLKAAPIKHFNKIHANVQSISRLIPAVAYDILFEGGGRNIRISAGM